VSVPFAPPAQPAQPTRRAGKAGLLRRLGFVVLAILVAALIFAAGNLASHLGIVNVGQLVGLTSPETQGASEAGAEAPAAQLAARLDEVAAFLDADALYRYTQGDLDTATAAAIRALIETSGDRYAQYYTAEEYASYLRGSEGEYSGIGVVLTTMDGAITVLQVYEGSPAFDADIKAGDVLLAIDGDRHDWEMTEATEAIRRASGEEVAIVWRRGTAERETTLTLREVNVPTIVSHLIGQGEQSIGYVYLRRFNTHSSSELREVIKDLDGRGARAYILDLRGNPGGYLSQAIDITSLFVPEGAVVQIEDRGGVTTRRVTGGVVTSKPLAVLVDGNSASASELVTAALADHGRATVVGEVTYGKGTVQDIRLLSWGGALKYTIAHYMSPNGTVLDGVGVTPDIRVEPASGIEGVGLNDHLTSGDYRYEKGVDPQLDAAIGALLGSPARGEAAEDGPS
jgi:carboxyl-terminal processing protease